MSVSQYLSEFKVKTPHVVTRVIRKVIIDENNCWVFTGGDSGDGYGKTSIRRKMFSSHRVVYEYMIGDVPKGKELDHLCRNRRCCNPLHLEPVTRSENVLRGKSPELTRLRHKMITHCPKGHAYDQENTYIRKNGKRFCRACGRDQCKARYKRGV